MQNSEELTLKELISILWSRKLAILVVLLISGLGSIFYSLSLPNLYTSHALLISADSENNSKGLINQYSSLATLGGISLNNNSRDRTIEALARIESFEFFLSIFIPSIYYPNLVAVKEWEPSDNSFIYNKNISKEPSKTPQSFDISLSSYQEAHKIFNKLLSIDSNDKTGLIKISITHHSPYIAKEWLEKIILGINESMRNEDRIKASTAVEFLNTQASQTNYDGIKQVLLSLQQEQMKSLMLIEANEDYIFRVLDSPVAPEKKSGPRRSIIVILSMIFASIVSVIFGLASFYIKENYKTLNS